MKTTRSAVFSAVAVAAGLFVASTVHAAANGSISVSVVTNAATCAASEFQISSTWDGVVDDNAGFDLAGMIAFDAAGVSVSSDWSGVFPASTITRDTPFGNGFVINDIAVRPLTIELYDIVSPPPGGQNTQAIFDDIVAQGAPLLARITYDPAVDVDACASLPSGATSAIPTFSQWGLWLLGGLLSLTALMVLYRRKTI